MSAQDIPDAIMNKIAALHAKAQSAESIGELQEAEAFASAVQGLLARYNLDMSEVAYRKMIDTDPVVERYINMRKQDGIKFRAKRVQWMERLSRMIAHAYMCRAMHVSYGSCSLWFVGSPMNTELCEYMFLDLVRIVEYVMDRTYRKERSQKIRQGKNGYGFMVGWRESFIEGFLSRLWGRFNEERNAINAEYAQSTALVRIDQALEKVDAYIKKINAKVERSPRIKEISYNGDGYRAGVNAADSINLKGTAIKAPKNTPSRIGEG